MSVTQEKLKMLASLRSARDKELDAIGMKNKENLSHEELCKLGLREEEIRVEINIICARHIELMREHTRNFSKEVDALLSATEIG